MIKNESSSQLLPSTPPALCFNKEHFTKDDFNVDQFVVECRKHASLDVLRTDLHMYLKILQNAMIELINKDYADFLNLSTNLVGMDKSINHLIQPLNFIKKDILELSDSAGERLKHIENKLQLKQTLVHKKECLKDMLQMLIKFKDISKLQSQLPSQEGLSRSQLIERLTNHFNRLQLLLATHKDTKLACNLTPKVQEVEAALLTTMKECLKESFSNKEELVVLLRSYAVMGRSADAEEVFQLQVVRQYMKEVIGEGVLREKGLEAMYEGVLQFVPAYCSLLKQLTAGSENWVSGYDMLVNAVWPEVVHNIELNVPSIFAPGNPDIFQKRYKSSMQFVSRFEKSLTSVASVKRMRSHPSYASFKAKWGLSIYFQIRFQEISGRLEASLLSPFELNPKQKEEEEVVSKDTVTWEVKPSIDGAPYDARGFKLQSSVALCHCLWTCWTEKVFLDALLHRFWKLSLQLCARYVTWLRDVTSEVPVTNHNSSEHQGKCLHLLHDLTCTSTAMKRIFEGHIRPTMLQRKDIDMNLIEDAWKDAEGGMQGHASFLVKAISHHLSHSCTPHLKAVSNIPRLYKRTNREAPSKPSPYVDSLLLPLSTFSQQQRASLPTVHLSSILACTVVTISEQYQVLIIEVLTSLRRMEESLKRFKAARQGGSSTGSSSGQSDDDKIRKQLCIDVVHFTSQVATLQLDDKERPEVQSALQRLKEAS